MNWLNNIHVIEFHETFMAFIKEDFILNAFKIFNGRRICFFSMIKFMFDLDNVP